MELVAQTLELKGCTCAEHNLDGAGEDVESLYGLALDMLVLDEGRCLLCTTEQYVHYLLRLYRIQTESENVLDNEFVHIVESSRSVEAFVSGAVMTSPILVPPLCDCHSCISCAGDCKFRIAVHLRKCLCNVLRSPLLPLLVDVFGTEQFTVKHTEACTHSENLSLEILLVGFVILYILFHKQMHFNRLH